MPAMQWIGRNRKQTDRIAWTGSQWPELNRILATSIASHLEASYNKMYGAFSFNL